MLLADRISTDEGGMPSAAAYLVQLSAFAALITHLNQQQSQFQKALDHDLAPLVDAVERRAVKLAQPMVMS